jgi:hypothetical protein
MGHLTDYEDAQTEIDKALAAIECSRAKSARARAWGWADTAIEHAEAAGIANARALVGDGRYPELNDLQAALEAARVDVITIVTNAFSINMLSPTEHEVHFIPLSRERAAEYLRDSKTWHSAVGHADAAAVFSNDIGITIPANRATIDLIPNKTRLLVGQYMGPRLPEGATTLPEGAEIRWWLVIANS